LGAIRVLSRGVMLVRPIVDAVQTAGALAEGGREIDVLSGDPEATRRLRELLGTSSPSPDEDALAVLPVTPDTPLETGAAALAHRRRSGGGALAVLIGSRDERLGLERRLLEGHRLEPSNVAHVAALDGPGEEAVLDAVIATLGDHVVAAGLRNPGLRHPVGKRIVAATSRRAAVVGALPLAGADMPVLAFMQLRMLALLAALHGRPLGAERVIEGAAVLGSGFGWRAVGRSAVGLVPGVGWAARGAVAYGATRALGEAALARMGAGHDLIEGPPVDAVKPQIERVLDRLNLGSS
jgi:uncharacterized protein (DUF697 family)